MTDPDGLAQTLVSLYGGTLKHTYKSMIKGFAAVLSDAAVAALNAQSTLVDYIEPDQKGGPDGQTQQAPQSDGPTQPSGSTTEQMDANGDPWGLDRIDQRALPLSGTYTYTSTGAGVHVYMIDTGIWTQHPEFGGRADNVDDVAGLGGEDCWGHGTATAGIVGSATYGVAKGVFLCHLSVATAGPLSLGDEPLKQFRNPLVRGARATIVSRTRFLALCSHNGYN